MDTALQQERQEVHALLNFVPASQLPTVRHLLESMLSPLERSLALAPIDDEPLTPEDIEALEEGRAQLARGEGIPFEEILAEFGVTLEELRARDDIRPIDEPEH